MCCQSNQAASPVFTGAYPIWTAYPASPYVGISHRSGERLIY